MVCFAVWIAHARNASTSTFLGSQPGNDSRWNASHWPGATGAGAVGVGRTPCRFGVAGAVGRGIGIAAGPGAIGSGVAPGPRPAITAAVMAPPATSIASAIHSPDDFLAGG